MFRPCANATAATGAPGCWHSARTLSLELGPYSRRWSSGCIRAHLLELAGTIAKSASAPFKKESLDAHCYASAPPAYNPESPIPGVLSGQ